MFDHTIPQSGPDQRIAIIGGGASGVLMALHLLRQDTATQIILIEKTGLLGCGVAYATRDPAHLLNTRVANMSAIVDEPDHFLNWLRVTVDPDTCAFSFVSRATYGQYLADTLEQAEGRARLTCVQAEVVRLAPQPEFVSLNLSDGQKIIVDQVVLATGHALPEVMSQAPLSLPWGNAALPNADADVLIIGTGLTMIDQLLSLLNSGHRGKIEAISRRGLLPQVHADAVPAQIALSDVPLGQSASVLMRWVRQQVRDLEGRGGDWRSVVDGLRPHVQKIWQALDQDARARFLRHACTFWEVHRHRVPPCSAQRVQRAIQDGDVILRRAAFVAAERLENGDVAVRLQPADGTTQEYRVFQEVIDCRGIRRDPTRHAAPVIRQMIAEGLAHVDPLGLGIVVDRRARVLRPDGSTLPRLTAIGPVSRSAFWEITAIPDIRQQAAWLSETLVKPECFSK